MYVCTCICISFLIAVCGTLFFNSQNFYAMNDVFLFACICKLLVNVFYLSVKLSIYTKFHVFTAIYCCYNYLSTVQKWDFTSYDQISVKSEPGLVVRKSLLIQVNCCVYIWPAIFLIDPDALIIPRTWYVLNECLKVCHI